MNVRTILGQSVKKLKNVMADMSVVCDREPQTMPIQSPLDPMRSTKPRRIPSVTP
jgi:hypothetical protein